MNAPTNKDKDDVKTPETKALEVKTAEAKPVEAKATDQQTTVRPKEAQAKDDPKDDPGPAQLLPDTGGYVNIAERSKGDEYFAEQALEDDILPQATVDEMSAGRAALERRNGTGKRRLDDSDAADIRNQRRERGEAGTAGNKK